MDPLDPIRSDVAEIKKLVQQDQVDKAVLQEKVNNLEEDLNAVPSLYVTRSEFTPVKSITFGLVAAVLMLFFTALGAIVFGGQPGATG